MAATDMNTQAVNFETWSQNTCFFCCFFPLVAAGSQRRTEMVELLSVGENQESSTVKREAI